MLLLQPFLSSPRLRMGGVAAMIAAFSPSLFAAPALWRASLFPSIQSVLGALFPPLVLAVPKKKISHSRKAMRSANKGLKDKRNIVSCPACGSPKLGHHLCPNCYSELSRGWKKQIREGTKE